MQRFKKTAKKLLSLALVLSLLLSTGTAAFAASTEIPATETESAYFTSTDWIWSTDTVTPCSMSYFRHDYDLKADPVSIAVRTSAHNHLKFYVNGNLITGYVSPAPTSLPQNVNYLSYTFTGSGLDALLNADKTQLALAAAVQYMGRGGMNYINAKPGFWAEVTVTYADGSSDVLVTDTTWRALKDTPYKNDTPSQSRRNMNAQLDYDAQKMPDPLAWTLYGYDESTYTAGEWTNAVPAASETSNWKMRRQEIPEGAVHEDITPTLTGRQQAGWQVFDAGRVTTGWVKIRASAPAGTRIGIRYSENLDGDVVRHVIAGEVNNENYCDFYTFSGSGVEEFAANFDYKSFRYFEVTGLSELITVENVTVEWASTNLEYTADFSSSDELLNKIYQACINTQINNMIGMPVDCPNREQSQYLADSQLQYPLLSYAFSNFKDINYKTLLDFASQQFDSGLFSFVAPSQMYASEYSLHIPEWDLRYPNMLYNYYWVSGDKVGLTEFYDNACANVNYYYQCIDSTGLMPQQTGSMWWHISDYPELYVPTNAGPYPTVCNILLFDAMNHLSKIADVLGKSEEADAWAQKANPLRNAINEQLLNYETGLYYSYSSTDDMNPGITAMAINLGVADPSLLDVQLKAISAPGIINTSVVLTYELFRAIMEHGTAAQKESVYQRILTSWGQMIKNGDNTCWEGFTARDLGSITHAWNAYPARMLLQYFTGIEYNGVDYTDISVTPFLPESMEHIEGTVTVPDGRGAVSVALSRLDGGYQLTVENTTADSALIAVPRIANANTVITVDGQTVFANGKGTDIDGIVYVKNDAEYVYFRADAGTVSFVSTTAEAQTGSFTLNIDAAEGGTVLVDGSEVTLPYCAAVEAGTEVIVEAKAGSQYAFTGWSGTYGSVNSKFTFIAGSDVNLTANFEKREGPVYRMVSIDAPQNSNLKVEFKGSLTALPAKFTVKDGEFATFRIVEPYERIYDFTAWSGDLFSPKQELTVTPTKNIHLKVIGSYRGRSLGNLALGKKVTSNNPLESAPKWLMTNLTDGYTTPNAAGAIGGTSAPYSNPDISANPYELVLDLGQNCTFDEIVLYPRTDINDEDGNVRCFPSSYAVSVCTDGGSGYHEVYSVSDAPNPKSNPVVIDTGSQTARYIKITATKLGLPDNYGTDYFVQLAEIQVFYSTASGLTDLALGKAVTSNNTLESAPKWLMTNLTDGYTTPNAAGAIGGTSGAYDSPDISANPYELVLDLGQNCTFDEVVLYPRTDINDEEGNVRCFPSSYSVSVCTDGDRGYHEVYSVSNAPNPKSNPVVIGTGTQTARYIKITATKLGLPDNYGTAYYVQMAEIQVFDSSSATDSANLVIDGTGTVLINGENKTLPVRESYEFGTRLAIQPVPDQGSLFSGWTGDLVSSDTPLYLTMDAGITLKANFTPYSGANEGSISISADRNPVTITSFEDLVQLAATVEDSGLADNSLVWSIEDEQGFVAGFAELANASGN
ncbi:MAG: family 78 glycoside hydrolase catalytic domain, partial [Clostridiales bacterium]|nr:family 78 glycoside hydrolase catalytic domain [Clostridiales bacterium]